MTVGASRGIVHEDDVVTGRAVRAQTWLTAAQLLNWVGGRGSVLVPAYCPQTNNTIKAGETRTLSYRVTPNGRAVRRVWLIETSGESDLLIKPGSTTVTVSSTATPSTFTITEDLAAKSAATQTLTLIITSSASASEVTLMSVACYEAPRPSLDAADYGVELLTEMVRAPIDSRASSSLGGIVDALALAPHRRHYVGHARAEEEAWSTTNAAYQPVLADGVIVTRKLYPASVDGDVRWYFYVKADATTTGTIRVTASGGGGSVPVTIPASASWSWVSVDHTHPCEDLSTADGLTGGTWPQYTVEFLRASGAGTVYLASVCAEEL
jgi:hypothetical protein